MNVDANLVRRVTFAVVAIPLALGLIWYGGYPLAIVLGLVGALGARELFDLAARGNVRPLRPLGIASAALLPLDLTERPPWALLPRRNPGRRAIAGFHKERCDA